MHARLVDGSSTGSFSIANSDPAKPPTINRGRQRSFRWAPRETSRDSRFAGRPGSKRHQRYLNRSFLNEQESFVEREDFNIHNSNFCAPLDMIFQDEELKQKWEQFLSSTEEQQEQMLVSSFPNSSAGTKNPRKRVSFLHQDQLNQTSGIENNTPEAHKSFNMIDRKIRKVLLRHCTSDFLNSLDHQIMEFIKQRNNLLVYPLSEPLQRILCHGVCQFYSLQSKSKIKWGQKVVVIENHQNTVILPAETLFQYLQRTLCTI